MAGLENLKALGVTSFSEERNGSKGPPLVQPRRHALLGRKRNTALAVAAQGWPVSAQVVEDTGVGERQCDREGLMRLLGCFQTPPAPPISLLGIAQNEQRPGEVQHRPGIGDVRTEERVE